MTDPSLPDTAQLDTVEGWFYTVDVDFFSALLGCQTADDIRGDMLEIGTYRGKSAILMAYGLRDEEDFVICDLFGAVMDHADIPLNRRQQYSGLEQDEFLANWDRFHTRRPTLEVCESSELDLGDREFRFIHVDGCHSYQCVVKDISLAATHTAKRGVIALDDYRAAEAPGVPAAIWQAVDKGLLYPFAGTWMKMYACASVEDQKYWLERVKNRGEMYAFPDFEMAIIS